MDIIKVLKENQAKICLILIIAIISVVLAGCVLFPSVFYDNWIWKYYWGPVVADATPGVSTATYNGVTAAEGYTIISEITYGVILIAALYGIYQLLKKLKIVVDWRFALALMPYIVFGPVSRTLEDTGYFSPPLVYWYISPFIYLQIAVFAIFFLLLGYFLKEKYKEKNITVNKVLFVGGLIVLLPSLFLTAKWILGDQWGVSNGIRFDVCLVVVGLVSLIVGLVYFLPCWCKYKDKLKAYRNPLNLAMLAGHLLDGITSYLSIKDPLAMGLYYSEKHPASNLLLEVWGPLFPITKFVLIMVVIYIFDIYLKDELKDYMTLVNLLKICILILGFSPGLRDILRVTMGV